ncbi:MAG TPA: hypothetical protein VL418_08190 [Devosiaceae bacterium]|nr:hypothetical protein [Devosiaceae bacterium]
MRTILIAGFTISALAASLPALAAPPAGLAGLMHSCQTQMYMSVAACSCLLAKAQAQLDDKQIAYLSIPGDNGPMAVAATRGMRASEIAQIDKFMRTVPEQCQKAQ